MFIDSTEEEGIESIGLIEPSKRKEGISSERKKSFPRLTDPRRNRFDFLSKLGIELEVVQSGMRYMNT